MGNKIVFYGVQTSLVKIGENKLTETVKFGVFETEKERQEVIDFVCVGNSRIIAFDITQEIMDLFNLKTKEDVKEKLRKEFENTRKKLGSLL